MRIHSIRVTNLASLRGEQPAIDLRGPQLGDAGLIAVTGPTGAGKTTLFDAVCLALFDETPRTRLRGRDPRDLLSRGAGEAQVAIELELDDGARWRAEWSVHRARFQAGGPLQNSRQRIVDAATGAVLAEGKKGVQALVEKSLGLSFDQFTSVILIAQGQFAKFLETTDADRSALLERLTGSEIYSELSRAAFERSRLAQERVAELDKLAGHFAGLSPDERQQLEARLEESEAELGGQDAALSGLELAARRLGELLERQGRARAAGADLAAAVAAIAAAAPDEERRLRALRGALAAPALERREEARRAAGQAVAERESCAAAATAAGAELAAAGQALAAGWALLLSSRREAERLHHELRGAEALAGDTLEDLRGLWRQRQRTRELLAKGQDEVGEAQRELERAKQENFEAAGQLHAAREKVSPLRTELASLETQVAEVGEGRGRDQWARRRLDLQQAAELAGELRRLDLKALEKEEKQLAKVAEGKAKSLEEARARLAAAREAREQQEALLRLASRQAHLAEHRPLLEEGEPCPLCGALEHPWSEREAAEDEGVLRRAELDKTERQMAERAAEEAVAKTAAELRGAELAVARAVAQRENAEKQIAKARGRWLELRLVLPELPAEPAGYETAEPASIAARLDRFDRLLPQEERVRRALALAEKELATAETHQAVVGERLHAAEGRRSGAAAGLAAAAEEDGRAEQLFLGCASDIAGRAGVAPPGNEKALDFLARLEAHLAAWQAARERSEDLAALEDRTRRRRPELAGRPLPPAPLSADGEGGDPFGGRGFAPPAPLAVFQQLETTDGSASRGAGGVYPSDLGSPPSPSAETGAGGRGPLLPLASLEHTLEQALDKDDQTREVWRLREDRLARATADLVERRRQLAAAEGVLAAALAEQLFAAEDDLRAAILPPAELAALERRLEQLAKEKDRREERLRLAEQELEELARKAGVAGGADLDVEKANADAAFAAAKEQHAALLARNIELRSRLQTEIGRSAEREKLAAELAEAKEKLDLAARLSALIGQKDGGKFRRFAQQLNLDLLLELANLRLDRLAPRYQLARAESLELEVIDREMADERRPVSTLSGGESFLVSLALALALADLRRGSLRLGTLFLDEGFGSLDEDTLDTALSVLEQLQADQNTQILIISHVGALKERIDHRIDIQKLGGGRSRLQILGG
jgi:exonuclease SbcC